MGKKKSGSVQLYKLPNHSWHLAEWNLPGSKYDTPEIVIRRVKSGVLVRNCSWEQAKEPRYDYSKQFCGENHPNDTWKSIDLYITGHSIINILVQRAREANADAAMELARLASESTAHLNVILKRRPELVAELARVRRSWPVIKQKKAKLSEAEQKLFAQIKLGEDDFIELNSNKAKWRFDDAGIIAYGLLSYVRSARLDNFSDSSFSYGSFGKSARKHLLTDFNRDSAVKWWRFAEEVFLLSYPDPTVIVELDQLVKAESNRKPKSRFKQAILDVLKNRFLSFAPSTREMPDAHLCDCGNPATSKRAGDWVCATCRSYQT